MKVRAISLASYCDWFPIRSIQRVREIAHTFIRTLSLSHFVTLATSREKPESGHAGDLVIPEIVLIRSAIHFSWM